MKSDKKENLASTKYIQETFIQENEERLKILKDLKKENKIGIQVSPIEGHILWFLARLIQAKKIVEVGTLFGYSTSWWVQAVGLKGQVWSFEKNKDHFEKASYYLNHHIQSRCLKIILGDAREKLKTIQDQGPFDLIFIDANKSAYRDYLDWAEKSIRKGGLIVADNTFLFGHIFSHKPPKNYKKSWQVLKDFNTYLAKSDQFESILLPTAEGLTVALKV